MRRLLHGLPGNMNFVRLHPYFACLGIAPFSTEDSRSNVLEDSPQPIGVDQAMMDEARPRTWGCFNDRCFLLI